MYIAQQIDIAYRHFEKEDKECSSNDDRRNVWSTWKEIEYRLNLLRATNKAY